MKKKVIAAGHIYAIGRGDVSARSEGMERQIQTWVHR